MRKTLLFTLFLFIPLLSFGQSFEAWIGGGVSHLSNSNIGSIDGTPQNMITLQNGWRMNFRMAINTGRFWGHEILYAYNRADWNVAGTSYGSAIHQGGYNFLVYFVPEGKARIRPFATGGVHFSNFVYPGYSATSGGGSTKFGYNYGAGLKVRVSEIFGFRLDYRRYDTGKPFDFPLKDGRIKQDEFSLSVGVLL